MSIVLRFEGDSSFIRYADTAERILKLIAQFQDGKAKPKVSVVPGGKLSKDDIERLERAGALVDPNDFSKSY